MFPLSQIKFSKDLDNSEKILKSQLHYFSLLTKSEVDELTINVANKFDKISNESKYDDLSCDAYTDALIFFDYFLRNRTLF